MPDAVLATLEALNHFHEPLFAEPASCAQQTHHEDDCEFQRQKRNL